MMTEKQEHIAALLALNTPFRKIQKAARATPQEINQVKRLLTQHTPMKTEEITGTIAANPETDAQISLPLAQDVTPLQPVPMTATQEITAQERSLMLLDFLQEIIPDTHAASVSLGTAKTWLLAEPLNA